MVFGQWVKVVVNVSLVRSLMHLLNSVQAKLMLSACFEHFGSLQEHGVYQSSWAGLNPPAEEACQFLSKLMTPTHF